MLAWGPPIGVRATTEAVCGAICPTKGRLSVAFYRGRCYNKRVELNLKAHWGSLAKRWLYAVGLWGLAAALSFLTQYLWGIRWYAVFAPVSGILALAMAYNTISHLRTRVRHNAAGDAIVITDGLLGNKEHRFAYRRMTSYRTQPNALADKVGCTSVTLVAASGVGETVTYTVCLSKVDAQVLLDDLASHLA